MYFGEFYLSLYFYNIVYRALLEDIHMHFSFNLPVNNLIAD